MMKLPSRVSSLLGMTLALAFVCGGVAEAKQDNPCPGGSLSNVTSDIAGKTHDALAVSANSQPIPVIPHIIGIYRSVRTVAFRV